jgi:NAD+ kinase
MKKLLLYGVVSEDIKKTAETAGLTIVSNSPEIIASVGGDGTLMKAENDYPGVPKFILRQSPTCKKCHDFSVEEFFKKVVEKQYSIEEEIKIEARVGEDKLIGLNEVIIHNSDPRQAIRYEVIVNGKNIGKEIIGDGVIISTPFGSTGYYRSITDGIFEVGIGVAFNNSTEQVDHMVLREDSEVEIRIMRGPAVAYADNNEQEISLKAGDKIVIRKSDEVARIIKFK